MATFYDKNTDYKALMDKAIAAGDTASAAFYESLRNAKIRGEGLSEKFPETHLYDMGAPNQLGVSTFGSYSLTDPITATRPTLMGTPMGDLYGINYDQDYIRKLLDDATAAEYNAKRQEFAATEHGYYNQLYDAQNTALDTIRASNSAAVASGASKGMAAAQQLAAILGLQQESVGAATDLANQRNELAAQDAAAYSENANTALNTSNNLKQAIQNADLTKYGYDTQNYVGELDYNAALRATIAEIIQSQNAAAATMYNADRNLDGTRYAADANSKYYGSGRTSGNGSGSGNKSNYGNSSYTGSGGGNNSSKGYNNGGLNPGVIKELQRVLGVEPDGKWGPKTQQAAKDKWGSTSANSAYDAYNKQIINQAKPIDAVTGAAPRYNWVSKSTMSGETIYYDKGSGKYRYNNNIYNTESEAREARDKAIKNKNKNKNKKDTSSTQQNRSTTGSLTQIKWT